MFSQGLKVKAPILILTASHTSVHPNAEESSGFVGAAWSRVRGEGVHSVLFSIVMFIGKNVLQGKHAKAFSYVYNWKVCSRSAHV